MLLAIGNKVVYPTQGPCRIRHIVKRIVDGKPIKFYHMFILGGGGELYVPVDKAHAIGVRLLLDRSEIAELFGQLPRADGSLGSGRQQAIDNSKRFSSGSPFDLALIVESLTELRKTKALTIGQSQTLDKARRLLVWEISEVLGETREEAEGHLDRALKARAKERMPVL